MLNKTNGHFLSSEDVSTITGIKTGTLAIWRSQNRGPRYKKLGLTKRARVVYLEQDVLDWINNPQSHDIANDSNIVKNNQL